MAGWQPQEYDPRQQRPTAPPPWGAQPPQDDTRGYTQPPQYERQLPPWPQGQYQQQQPYQPYGHDPRYAPRPRRKHTGRNVLLGAGGALMLLIIIIVAAAPKSPPSPASSSSAPAQTQAAAPAHSTAPAAAVAKTVATFSGSGITNTAKFTVSSTWELKYSFDCSNFGESGNFIVMEDGSFGALSVNVLSLKKAGSSYAYNDAGTHYLEVNSECAWTVKVVDVSS
jgi:hypothetical protein